MNPATSEVLDRWDAWLADATDRLFALDERATAFGDDRDRLDVAAAFLARKAIAARVHALREAGDGPAAAALGTRPLVDEHGELVAADLPTAAALVDGVVAAVGERLDATERTAGERDAARAAIRRDLARVVELSGALATAGARAAELERRAAEVDRGAWDPAAGAALAADLAALRAELDAAAAERERLVARWPGLAPEIDALREREADVRALVAHVREKVRPVPVLAVPSVDALAAPEPLDELLALPWPAARARMAPAVERVDRVRLALDEVDARHRAALARRDELRGLLQGFRDKAGARGAGEHPRLEPAYREAHDVLWSAPCDLDAASVLVDRYVAAVNREVGG